MIIRRGHRPDRQAGFSLLEMLVALFIGLVAVTGILYLYKSHQKSLLTQDSVTEMGLNGQFALNEAIYFLSHAGLGLPVNMEDIMVLHGDLAVKMNPSRKSSPGAKHPTSTDTRVVYRIPAADSGLFMRKSYAVVLAGSLPKEARILSVNADPPGGIHAYVSVQGDSDDFPASALLYPMDRVRLHVCTGAGSDTIAGDFRILPERASGRPAADTDSLTLAENIQSLGYTYFHRNGRDSTQAFPAMLDSLESIRVSVVARTSRQDASLPGDGYRRRTFTAKVNYRRSL